MVVVVVLLWVAVVCNGGSGGDGGSGGSGGSGSGGSVVDVVVVVVGDSGGGTWCWSYI